MAQHRPPLFDRLLGAISPARALRRHVQREQLKRAYEGAARTDGWLPRRAGSSANQDHAMDARELRIRSRALVQNVPYIAHGLRSLTANVIGTGITPNWAGADGDVLNTLWSRWKDECDADGRLNLYGLQAAAYRAMQQDGEVLIRLRPRLKSDGLAVPLQLQLLEIDYLDADKNADLPTGGQIVNGIEYSPIGRIEAYWLLEQHPGDAGYRRAASRRIDAANIIHLFTPERPGQGRGFPRLSPVIARVRDLQLYEDAELNRKNLEARLSVLGSGNIDIAQSEAAALEGANATGTTTSLPSGGYLQMPAGQSFTVVQPNAAPGYVDYVKYQLHLIAAGFGVTYEMMTGDVREVNFSSARVRLLDFRREAEVEQWSLLVPNLCDRICRAFEDAASLAGSIRRATYNFYHSTPKWSYVDPLKDVSADRAEISAGLSSISEKLRQRGYKPADVFQELAEDIQTLKDLGILDALSGLRSALPLDVRDPAPAD